MKQLFFLLRYNPLLYIGMALFRLFFRLQIYEEVLYLHTFLTQKCDMCAKKVLDNLNFVIKTGALVLNLHPQQVAHYAVGYKNAFLC